MLSLLNINYPIKSVYCKISYKRHKTLLSSLHEVVLNKLVYLLLYWNSSNQFYLRISTGKHLRPPRNHLQGGGGDFRFCANQIWVPPFAIWQNLGASIWHLAKPGCHSFRVLPKFGHLKCKCSSKQECFKFPCCTILSGWELLYPFSKCWH